MSAYVVSDKQLNVLATWMYTNDGRIYPTDDSKPMYDEQTVVEILKRQNVRSVAYRYSEAEEDSSITFQYEYLRSPLEKPTLAVEVLSLLACYDYQACETPDYRDTEACRIVERIRAQAIRNLPGYDKAPWSI
jgi:hypothetical protein